MLNECKYRPYKCEHCDYEDTYEAITERAITWQYGWLSHSSSHRIACHRRMSHYDECPEYPLPCPNKCGAESIKRKDMDGLHQSCLLEPLDCPLKDAGCIEKIMRKHMDRHMERNTQQHILKLFLTHQELKARVEQLERNQEVA